MLRPVQAARALSTRACPGSRSMRRRSWSSRAGAGTPLAEIEAAVAENGQHLIAEPPDFSALLGSAGPPTLGGIVAANLSGPRRVAWGAMRDHVLGVRGGERPRRGDPLGRAGVEERHRARSVQAARRKPRHAGGADRGDAEGAAGAGDGRDRGAERTGRGGGSGGAVGRPRLALRGVRRGVAAGGRGGAGRASGRGDTRPHRGVRGLGRLPHRAPARRSGAVRRPPRSSMPPPRARCGARSATRSRWARADDAIWRVSVRPTAGPAVARALVAAFDARLFLDWGGGLVWVAGPDTADAHAAVEAAARGAWRRVDVAAGPEALRAAVAVIPPEPAPLARPSRGG